MQQILCRFINLLIQHDSVLLTYKRWQERNRPVRMFHKSHILIWEQYFLFFTSSQFFHFIEHFMTYGVFGQRGLPLFVRMVSGTTKCIV